jgi:putative PEP-CTERM system histidine kinase
MTFSASSYAYVAAFLGYAVFAVILTVRSSRSWLATLFILAAGLTAAWSGSFALSGWSLLPGWVPEFLGPLRDGSWYAIALAVLYFFGQDRTEWRFIAAAVATLVAMNAVFAAGHLDAGVVLGVRIDSRVIGVAELCLGFVLLENMMRNLDQDRFWSAKHFGIGLGTVLVFRALVLIPELLTDTVPAGMVVAWPLVYLLVIPLFVVSAIRSPGLELRVHSSRKIVFQTTALIAIGVVLQGAALAAYYLRTKGGDNGTVLAILLGFGSIVGFAVVLSSRTVRSRIATFINENFYSYKYDYRLEWQNFIRAVSQWQDDNVPLGVLRTLAEILDSPGGALWVWRERWNRFMPVAHWSFDRDLPPIAARDTCLHAFKDESCTFIDLSLASGTPSSAVWQQRYPGAWLAVPFRYRSALAGFALINSPRSDRKLHWEDKSLISLVALQLAAYLVQHETAQALADARQLEQFNKRFAFILHDTKNAIGQLTLLVRNAEQYGHDQEFRKDMVVTLRNSVEKLQGLLASLTGSTTLGAAGSGPAERVDVSTLASSFVQDRRRLGYNVILGDGAGAAFASLSDPDAFLGVLEHVVTNALEATPAGKPVTIRISGAAGFVCLAIEDKGPGMSDQFIADELFRPLKSTKKTGFGIGAYQAREIMRDLGGNIEVRSKPDEGTTVTLMLPEFISEREAEVA